MATESSEFQTNNKEVNGNNSNSHVRVESELNQICADLFNDQYERLYDECRKCLDDITQSLRQQDIKHEKTEELLACCLYVVIINTRSNDVDDEDQRIFLPTITQLLNITKVHVTRFFKAMKLVKENYDLPQVVQEHLLQLEKKYCIMSALYHTFERICQCVFREENSLDQDNNQENFVPPTPDTEGVSFRKRLIWTLFLHAKNHFMNGDQELVKSLHLLLCCVEYVLRLTPSFLLLSPYDSIRIGCSPQHQTNGMLGKLAEQFDSCIDEVQLLQSSRTESYFMTLPNVDDLDKLTEQYEEEYEESGGLNDLLFLTESKSLPLLQSPRENGETSADTSCVTMTPVRAALNTVQQLKNILNQITDEPSETLLQYFKNCSKDPEDEIRQRINEMKEIFIKQYCATINSSDDEVATQRYQLAVRLYFRVQEAMLKSEHERLSETDFSRLLNNESFHRSLLACSVEVVLVTYGVSWNPVTGAMGCEDSAVSFPWILKVFNLQAFEFFKVLESFIKAEPKLTREIVRHLQNVENRILECEAWKRGSILYDTMYRSEKIPMEFSSPSKSEPCTNYFSSAADMYLSPMKNRSGIIAPSPVKVPSPSGLSFVNEGADKSTRRSQSLNLFLNKVYRLSYSRLQKLCGMLKVTKDLMHRIWTCLEHCITKKPQLIENRHIDQIMMCSIYAICKVVEKEIKFKVIVQKYRNLPHASQEVFKNAFIGGDKYDSIIGFYNLIFMEKMKQFILQFSNNKTVAPPLSPVPKAVASPSPSAQKISVPGIPNLYLSPLKKSPFKTPSPGQMTPRSRQLYCFGEERVGLSESLQSINERVSDYHNQRHSGRGRTRLSFDQPDESSASYKVPRLSKSPSPPEVR